MAKTITEKLYFAYGMNTNAEQMAWRCPTAQALGKALLRNYKFEFKHYATIVPSPGNVVEGVLWKITDRDEEALDILEGYPDYYDKINVTAEFNNINHIAMTYIMDPKEQLHVPSEQYYATVSQGYQRFGLSQHQLLDAKMRSNHFYVPIYD